VFAGVHPVVIVLLDDVGFGALTGVDAALGVRCGLSPARLRPTLIEVEDVADDSRVQSSAPSRDAIAG